MRASGVFRGPFAEQLGRVIRVHHRYEAEDCGGSGILHDLGGVLLENNPMVGSPRVGGSRIRSILASLPDIGGIDLSEPTFDLMSTNTFAVRHSADEILGQISREYDAVRREGCLATRSGGSHAISPTGLSVSACEDLRAIVTVEARTALSQSVTTRGVRQEQEAGAFRTLEIGFAYGLSTVSVLRGAIEGGVPPVCLQHVAIDPFAVSSWGDAGRIFVERCGLGSVVEVIEKESAFALPELAERCERFDFIFVDGGHRFEEIFLDLYYASRLIRPGGPVVVDDLWMPSIRKALRYFQSNGLTLETTEELEGDAGGLGVFRFAADDKRPWDHFIGF